MVLRVAKHMVLYQRYMYIHMYNSHILLCRHGTAMYVVDVCCISLWGSHTTENACRGKPLRSSKSAEPLHEVARLEELRG